MGHVAAPRTMRCKRGDRQTGGRRSVATSGAREEPRASGTHRSGSVCRWSRNAGDLLPVRASLAASLLMSPTSCACRAAFFSANAGSVERYSCCSWIGSWFAARLQSTQLATTSARNVEEGVGASSGDEVGEEEGDTDEDDDDPGSAFTGGSGAAPPRRRRLSTTLILGGGVGGWVWRGERAGDTGEWAVRVGERGRGEGKGYKSCADPGSAAADRCCERPGR